MRTKEGKSQRVHDMKVRQLGDILVAEYDYDDVILDIIYGDNRVVGQVDVLGVDHEAWDFYEVKCNDSSKLWRKANKQYQRFREYFPTRVRYGFFYCGGDIIKLKDGR